jgi:hypothetical protein
MKTLFAIAIMFTTSVTFGQLRPFEGTIVYRVHMDGEEDDAQVTATFGKNAIRISVTDKGGDKDVQTILLRLDSGKVYFVEMREKQYMTMNLGEYKKPTTELKPKTIAGYTSRPFEIIPNPGSMLLGKQLRGGSAIFFQADSLYFPVPDKYAMNPELMMVQNNRIILAAEIQAADRSRFDDDVMDEKESERRITAEAVSVKWQSLDEKDLSIPEGFRKYSYADMNRSDSIAAMADTTMTMVDSVAMPSPVKEKPAVKKAPTGNKTPTKSKTKTSPARKPE